jgi:hypothetical protein
MLADDRRDSVPDYLRAVAELELAESCTARRQALRTIRELGDPRASPAAERLASAPRTGCGILGLGDCHSCIRRDLRATLAALGSKR